jgi:hypothetical protein
VAFFTGDTEMKVFCSSRTLPKIPGLYIVRSDCEVGWAFSWFNGSDFMFRSSDRNQARLQRESSSAEGARAEWRYITFGGVDPKRSGVSFEHAISHTGLWVPVEYEAELVVTRQRGGSNEFDYAHWICDEEKWVEGKLNSANSILQECKFNAVTNIAVSSFVQAYSWPTYKEEQTPTAEAMEPNPIYTLGTRRRLLLV